MKRRGPNRKARSRKATAEGAEKHLTLQQAAAQIGMNPADLAGFIREAGLEPEGPEDEWVLEADDVRKLKAERDKMEQRNLGELEKAARSLE